MTNIINYFWIFILGSFIGCLVETIWCIIKNKKYESRKGLIYGYFIPIYGVAAMLISFTINLFSIKNFISFFVVTFIICGLVEYISSCIQEKCFGTKSWDYSKMILNIHGRINVLYLLFFSILGMFWCKYYLIIINGFIAFLEKYDILYVITFSSMILMFYNCLISIIASIRQRKRKQGINPKNKLEEYIDKKFDDEYMKKIYSNAKFID